MFETASTKRSRANGKSPHQRKSSDHDGFLAGRTPSPSAFFASQAGGFLSAIQSKRAINQPGDIYEQEADRVAEQMMRMPEPKAPIYPNGSLTNLQRKPLTSQIPPLIQRQSISLNPQEVRPRGTGAPNEAKVTISGAPPGAVLTPTVTAVANSGGHQHNGKRPVGKITPRRRTADSTGSAEFSYRSNTPGGIETIAVDVGGTKVQKDIDVLVPNLVDLPTSANYDLIGATPIHPVDNHFGTADTIAKLQQIAADYENHKHDHNLTNWPLVAYNDVSLERGGLFDIKGDWRPSHHEHREGTIVDFRINHLNKTQRNVLTAIIQNNGGRILNEGNHWHIRF